MTDAIVEHQGSFMPAMSIDEAVSRYNAVIEFTRKVMKQDKDYGVIPGTGTKPTLLKPGAEKLCSLFGFTPDFVLEDKIVDFDNGIFYFQYRCNIYKNDKLIASGLGSCNSKEKKYRYRNVPEKKATDTEKACALRLEERSGKYGKYKVYVIENTEPFDLVNTFDKMAQKRSLVAATLIAANASEFFTQDIEDMGYIEGMWTEAPQHEPEPGKDEPVKVKKAAPKKETNGRPYPPEKVRQGLADRADKYPKFDPSDAQRNLLRHGLELCFDPDDEALKDKRHTVLAYLTGHGSTKETSGKMFKAIIEDWLKMKQPSDGGGTYAVDPMAIKEAQSIVVADSLAATIDAINLNDEGQQELI